MATNTSTGLVQASPLAAGVTPVTTDPYALGLTAKSEPALPAFFGAENDVIEIGNASSTIFAGEGNNVILGGTGNNQIFSGAGRDIIDLAGGNNTIFAGDGVNLITTGAGKDVIYAGSGRDFIDAGDGKNTVYAGDGDNRILTGKGNDLIFAGAGNDVIYSGAGNDRIIAGNGNNVINAGTGDDIVTIGSGNDKIILEAGKGSVTIVGFNTVSDKLRLGESLLGKSLTFVTKGADTEVFAGKDLLATLKGVKSGSQALIDRSPLFRYQATDLGSLSTNPNGAVNAASINDFGVIAGRFDTGATFSNTNATTGVVNANNLVRQGFVWENGTQTALTSTGVKNGQSDFGAANGATVTLLTPNVNTINNRGLVFGTGDEVRQPNPLATDRALIWTLGGPAGGGSNLQINDFGGVESYVFDANNRNQIPGRNIDAKEFDTPIYRENGVNTVLANLGGDGGTARGINGKGEVVGYVDSDGVLDGKTKNTATVWKKDDNGNFVLTDLGTFGSEQAQLRDINNAGSIIGATSDGSGATATSSPFLIRDGEFTVLGSLGGKTGSANGINEFNQVVGASQIASGTNRAYLFDAGVQTDLNNLISTPLTYNGAAVTLTSATAINNFGEIVATGTYTYKDVAGVSQTGTRSFVLKAIA